MPRKKWKKSKASGGANIPSDPMLSDLFDGNAWALEAPDALYLAESALLCENIVCVRRAAAGWATLAIVKQKFPPEVSGYDLARLLQAAFLEEWRCRKTQAGGDALWLRGLFGAAIAVADHEAKECLLLGVFEHLLQDAEVRAFFKGWAGGSEALAAFYAEACELADGFIELRNKGQSL